MSSSGSYFAAERGSEYGLPTYRQAIEAKPLDSAQQIPITADEMPRRRRSSVAESPPTERDGRIPPQSPPRRAMSLPFSPPPEGGVGSSGSANYASTSRKAKRARTSKGAKYAVLLMGATGAGKSSFIAAATGLPVQVGHTLEPCTRVTAGFDVLCADGTQVTLIDTPGFNDPQMTDIEVLQSIIYYTVSHSVPIIAVMYLHKIVDKRVTGSAKLNLRMLRAVCGEYFLQNIALITTMWSAISPDGQADAQVREVELNTSEGFWSDMLKGKGAQYYRWHEAACDHMYTAKQITELCKSNIQKSSAPYPTLQILLELSRGAPVEATSAGQILTEELRRRQENERKAIEEEEDQRLTLQQEHQELQARLQAARGSLRRETEASTRHTNRSERAFGRSHGSTSVFVLPTGRQPGLAQPVVDERIVTDHPHTSTRAGRAKMDDDERSREEYQQGSRSYYRRHSGRDYESSSWKRVFRF